MVLPFIRIIKDICGFMNEIRIFHGEVAAPEAGLHFQERLRR